MTSNTPNSLDEFKDKLEEKKDKAVSAEIGRYISTQDLQDIYKHFADNEHLYKDIKPGETNRFKKCTGDNPTNRTVSIMRNAAGEYHLILETKSKLASNLKDEKTAVMKGAAKYGKFSWRIDTDPPQKWISLRTPLNRVGVNIEKERKLMEELQHPNVATMYTGDKYNTYSKKHYPEATQRQIFAPAALGSLDNLMQKNILSEEDKHNIMLDILNGLQFIHSKGYVHQDIKPENILIYQDPETQKYTAKISDFGSAKKITEPPTSPVATYDYASPEVFAANVKGLNATLVNYFKQKRQSHGKDVYNSAKTKRRNASINDKNDSWALGILAYRMYYGKSLNEEVNAEKINQLDKSQLINTLIQKLLTANQEQRLSCSAALAEMGQMIKTSYDKLSPISESTGISQEAVVFSEERRAIPKDNLCNSSPDKGRKGSSDNGEVSKRSP